MRYNPAGSSSYVSFSVRITRSSSQAGDHRGNGCEVIPDGVADVVADAAAVPAADAEVPASLAETRRLLIKGPAWSLVGEEWDRARFLPLLSLPKSLSAEGSSSSLDVSLGG